MLVRPVVLKELKYTDTDRQNCAGSIDLLIRASIDIYSSGLLNFKCTISNFFSYRLTICLVTLLHLLSTKTAQSAFVQQEQLKIILCGKRECAFDMKHLVKSHVKLEILHIRLVVQHIIFILLILHKHT